MKRNSGRMIALTLALVFILSLFPAGAFAESVPSAGAEAMPGFVQVVDPVTGETTLQMITRNPLDETPANPPVNPPVNNGGEGVQENVFNADGTAADTPVPSSEPKPEDEVDADGRLRIYRAPSTANTRPKRWFRRN